MWGLRPHTPSPPPQLIHHQKHPIHRAGGHAEDAHRPGHGDHLRSPACDPPLALAVDVLTGLASAVDGPGVDVKGWGLSAGRGAKMCTVAGPVIVCGGAASAVYGVFLMGNQLGWW